MTEAPVLPVHMRRDKFDPAPELLRLREEQPITPMELAWGGKG